MHFSAGHPEDIPQGKSKIRPRRKEVFFIELIFHTYRSPHIGSKLCYTKGTQLISIPLSVLQSLEVSCRQQMIRHSSFQGAQRCEY